MAAKTSQKSAKASATTAKAAAKISKPRHQYLDFIPPFAQFRLLGRLFRIGKKRRRAKAILDSVCDAKTVEQLKDALAESQKLGLALDESRAELTGLRRSQHDSSLKELERETAWHKERAALFKQATASERSALEAELKSTAALAELQAVVSQTRTQRDEARALLDASKGAAERAHAELRIAKAASEAAEKLQNRTRDELQKARAELAKAQSKVKGKCDDSIVAACPACPRCEDGGSGWMGGGAGGAGGPSLPQYYEAAAKEAVSSLFAASDAAASGLLELSYKAGFNLSALSDHLAPLDNLTSSYFDALLPPTLHPKALLLSTREALQSNELLTKLSEYSPSTLGRLTTTSSNSLTAKDAAILAALPSIALLLNFMCLLSCFFWRGRSRRRAKAAKAAAAAEEVKAAAEEEKAIDAQAKAERATNHARLAAAARLVHHSASHTRFAYALKRWSAATAELNRREATRSNLLTSCIRHDELGRASVFFHRWLSIVVGLQSALHQQSLHNSALEQVARDYEVASRQASETASARGSARGLVKGPARDMLSPATENNNPHYYHRSANVNRPSRDDLDSFGGFGNAALGLAPSPPQLSHPGPQMESAAEPDWLEEAANDLHTFEEESASLSTSLRTLGSNLYHLARSQQLDTATVFHAPRALYGTARHLVPRLAGHVSPTRLLNKMVVELNETLTSSMASTSHGSTSHQRLAIGNCGDSGTSHTFAGATTRGANSHHTLDGASRMATNYSPQSSRRNLLTHEASAHHDPFGVDVDGMSHGGASTSLQDAFTGLLSYPRGLVSQDSNVSLPTEEALRMHNESQINEAAAAAAAVLARLPVLQPRADEISEVSQDYTSSSRQFERQYERNERQRGRAYSVN